MAKCCQTDPTPTCESCGNDDGPHVVHLCLDCLHHLG